MLELYTYLKIKDVLKMLSYITKYFVSFVFIIYFYSSHQCRKNY